jgi:endonuclease VIII
MPEGPSLVIFKKDIERFLGKRVKEASGVSKTIEPARLKGKTITALNTHGKHLLISFEEDLTLRVHFLMFGTYRFDQTKAAPIQLHLGFPRDQELNFYTCSLRFIEEDLDEVYDWRIDVMREEFDTALALKHLKALPEDIMICDALLDQTIFAGLGNIIKNEVLYRTRVQPESLVSAIPLKKKKEIVQDVLDYTQLFYEWRLAGTLKKHWQAHTKKTCAVCGGKLVKEYAGKTKRRSFYCPNCQELYA